MTEVKDEILEVTPEDADVSRAQILDQSARGLPCKDGVMYEYLNARSSDALTEPPSASASSVYTPDFEMLDVEGTGSSERVAIVSGLSDTFDPTILEESTTDRTQRDWRSAQSAGQSHLSEERALGVHNSQDTSTSSFGRSEEASSASNRDLTDQLPACPLSSRHPPRASLVMPPTTQVTSPESDASLNTDNLLGRTFNAAQTESSTASQQLSSGCTSQPDSTISMAARSTNPAAALSTSIRTAADESSEEGPRGSTSPNNTSDINDVILCEDITTPFDLRHPLYDISIAPRSTPCSRLPSKYYSWLAL
ncbi:hypothetical protein G7Y79_00012g032200 [Physcia stellaris]|nr:hypothetical protein G7Y79_00012g032200 [Physcia stellaris]